MLYTNFTMIKNTWEGQGFYPTSKKLNRHKNYPKNLKLKNKRLKLCFENQL